MGKQPNDTNRLIHASGDGKLKVVSELIAKGVSVNAANHVGGTPLMAASASYRVDVVTFLIASGANVRMKTADGRTALHATVNSTPSLPEEQAECVRILLEHGAEIDVQDQTGITPLMCAAWFGCTLAVRALLGFGASTTLRDAQGRTALDLAQSQNWSEVVRLLELTA